MGEKKLVNAINKRIKQQIVEYMSGSVATGKEVCEKFNVSYSTFWRWKNEDAEFREALETQNDYIVDSIESALLRNAEMGDVQSAALLLKSKGKKRGYTDKVQIDHTTLGESINKINVIVSRRDKPIDESNQLT